MKGFLIGIDNERFEAEIVRYFQNVNDYYLIYTKNEKDANDFVLLYATKIVSDNGIRVGENITDENEWALIKNFLKQTVNENKEGKPVTIHDCNPAEIADLKINAQKPFKLPETAVELFGQNKKSFEIVQQLAAEQNIVKTPVAPVVPEYVETPNIQPQPASPAEVPPIVPPTESTSVQPETSTIAETEPPKPSVDYEKLYNTELEKNSELNKEIEMLLKDNAELKSKLNNIKELLE